MTARTMYDAVSHYTAESGAVVWRLSGVDQLVTIYDDHRAGAIAPVGDHGRRRSIEGDSPFFGGSPAVAVRLAREGWPDGERKLADALKRADALAMAGAGNLSGDSLDWSALPDLVPSTSPAARWDLGDYMTGAPDLYREQVPPPARVLRLVLDGAVSASVKPHEIQAAAGALVAVIQQLQAQGVTVSVDLVFGGEAEFEKPGIVCLIPVISEGRTMDLDRLAFWLSHPCALRRFGLALFELTAPVLSGNYGRPLVASPMAFAALQADVARDPCAVLLPSLQTVIKGAGRAPLAEYALKQWSNAVQGGAA